MGAKFAQEQLHFYTLPKMSGKTASVPPASQPAAAVMAVMQNLHNFSCYSFFCCSAQPKTRKSANKNSHNKPQLCSAMVEVVTSVGFCSEPNQYWQFCLFFPYK